MTGSRIHSLVSTTRRGLINTASTSSLQTAIQWCNDCIQHHDCTRNLFQSSDQPEVFVSLQASERTSGAIVSNGGPKRLIDLRAFGESSLDARLIEPTSNANYVALSYCWGSAPTNRYHTTMDTLLSRQTRIDYSVMPLTIQHAFEFTRGLGLQYIWIDALCIIQDSKPDWQAESSKMGAVYSQALVTIAADWGDDVGSGCFNRVPIDIPTCSDNDLFQITSRLSTGDESSLYISDSTAQSSSLPEIEQSKLTSRAWACQERLLSARIIHFTEKQLFWECREKIIAEDGISRRWEDFHPAPRLKFHVTDWNWHNSTDDSLREWYGLIQNAYSKRQLTVSTDKLPAISALARLWSHYVGAPYLAGIWQKDVQFGLCWYRNSASFNSKPSVYRCPSWSWAAIEGEVHWRTEEKGQLESKIRLIDAGVQLESQDPFGHVIGGFIKVTGLVQTFGLRYDSASDLSPILLTAGGDEISNFGSVFMDTDDTVLLKFTGLWVASEPYWRGDDWVVWHILLLTTSPSDHEQYIRKGLARIEAVKSWLQPVFDGWSEQTITIV
ncbi:HET-domain-containing protein [Stipitochalara longipes BDJ]|nr:HET-domain-containing protein [Stipitochalara longipes BDJ]